MSEAALPRLVAEGWRPASWLRWAPGLPLLAAALFGVWLVTVTPFPAPDELEHVSYAAHLQETGRWLPLFDRQVTLDRTDLSRWDTRPNYIGHPSPYYLYIEQFLDRALPLRHAILEVRLASLALLLGGVALALAGGAQAFRADRAALWTFAVGVAWCPEALSVASQVNNDALAVLGGGLAYWGALRPARGGWRWGGPLAVAAGLMLGLWAKPNAGLELGVFAGALALLQGLSASNTCPEPAPRVVAGLDPAIHAAPPAHVADNEPTRFRRPDPWPWVVALAAGGLLGVLPTAPIVLGYGAVVPVAAETIWPVRSMPGFAEYWPVFLANIGHTWGFLATGTWPLERGLDWARVGAFWAATACVGAGGWTGLRRLRDRPFDPAASVAAAAVAAFLVVLPIHLWFASTRLGFSLPAASFRYYLPLWPGLLHALCFAIAAAPGRLRSMVLAVAAAAMLLGWT